MCISNSSFLLLHGSLWFGYTYIICWQVFGLVLVPGYCEKPAVPSDPYADWSSSEPRGYCMEIAGQLSVQSAPLWFSFLSTLQVPHPPCTPRRPPSFTWQLLSLLHLQSNPTQLAEQSLVLHLVLSRLLGIIVLCYPVPNVLQIIFTYFVLYQLVQIGMYIILITSSWPIGRSHFHLLAK